MKNVARHTAPIAFVAALTSLVMLAGCKQDNATHENRVKNKPFSTIKTPTGKTAFTQTRLQLCLEIPGGWQNRGLSAKGKTALSRLSRNRCLPITVLVGDSLSLLQFPPGLWPGRNLDLILASDSNALLLDRSGKQYWTGSAANMLDIMEGALHIERGTPTIKFLDAKKVPANGPGARPTRRLDFVVERDLVGPSSSWFCHRLVSIQLWSEQSLKLPATLRRNMVSAGLMALGVTLPAEIIEKIRVRTSLPIRWKATSQCTNWPSGRKPVARTLTLIPSPSGTPTWSVMLPGSRVAIPPPEARLRTGPMEAGPFRFVTTAQLGRLQGWSGRGERRTAPLVLQNRGPTAVEVLMDDFRLGVLPAGATYSFTGIPIGYHHLAATSPMGTLSWGPLDTYIPGMWTIDETGRKTH